MRDVRFARATMRTSRSRSSCASWSGSSRSWSTARGAARRSPSPGASGGSPIDGPTHRPSDARRMVPEPNRATGPLRLLAILAHPDDETLGLGGVAARYADEGAEVHLVTATGGEGGRFRGLKQDDPGHPGREQLAAIREGELRAAAEVLGIRSVTTLGYPDGRLDSVDPLEAI